MLNSSICFAPWTHGLRNLADLERNKLSLQRDAAGTIFEWGMRRYIPMTSTAVPSSCLARSTTLD
jgi:hypothetical protein